MWIELSWQYWISFFSEKPNPTCIMQNEAGEYVDMYIPRWAHRILLWTGRKCEFTIAMFWSFSQAIALELTSYCDMLFAGSAVPPTGSCPRGITPQSRYIWHLLTSNQVFFAINCELLVFSWLMATCVVWQMKSHGRQFTLVKQSACTVATWVPIWGTWSPWGPYSVFGSPFLFQGPHFLYSSSWTCEKSMQSLSNVDN